MVRLEKLSLASTGRPASTRMGVVAAGSQNEPSSWISTSWVTWVAGRSGSSSPGIGPWKGTRSARRSLEGAKAVPSKRSRTISRQRSRWVVLARNRGTSSWAVSRVRSEMNGLRATPASEPAPSLRSSTAPWP